MFLSCLLNSDSKDVHNFFIMQDMLSFDKNGISVMSFCFCVVHLTESSGYLNEIFFGICILLKTFSWLGDDGAHL